mmetsp:Transcript_59638/g.136787  ORF Transcript_59638/g.136787 Transcript_59638/m.136787 type:complete len:311 (+) Transcript_59638:236-1168(+)
MRRQRGRGRRAASAAAGRMARARRRPRHVDVLRDTRVPLARLHATLPARPSQRRHRRLEQVRLGVALGAARGAHLQPLDRPHAPRDRAAPPLVAHRASRRRARAHDRDAHPSGRLVPSQALLPRQLNELLLPPRRRAARALRSDADLPRDGLRRGGRAVRAARAGLRVRDAADGAPPLRKRRADRVPRRSRRVRAAERATRRQPRCARRARRHASARRVRPFRARAPLVLWARRVRALGGAQGPLRAARLARAAVEPAGRGAGQARRWQARQGEGARRRDERAQETSSSMTRPYKLVVRCNPCSIPLVRP